MPRCNFGCGFLSGRGAAAAASPTIPITLFHNHSAFRNSHSKETAVLSTPISFIFPLQHLTARHVSLGPHVSRRTALRLLSILLSIPMSALDDNEPSKLIRSNCAPFLRAIGPLTQTSLLWRGAEPSSPPPGSYSMRKIRSDLLDVTTYGADGVAFFQALEQTSLPVKPSLAHIGTGDKKIAATWGRPVVVFPVGEFRYAYWKRASLIYAGERSLIDAQLSNGPFVVDDDLRNALIAGKEVMFESEAIIELSEELLSQVLIDLTQNIDT